MGPVRRAAWRAYGNFSAWFFAPGLAERSRYLHGLAVEFAPDGTEASTLAPISEALDLIHLYSPWVLKRAQRDLRCICVGPWHASMFMWHSREVLVGEDWLQAKPVEVIAGGLVSSFTYARLRSLVPKGTHDLRVMRIAFERRVQFTRKLPNGLPHVAALTAAWDAGFYNRDNALRQRERQGATALEALEKLGAPPLMQRVAKHVFRRSIQRDFGSSGR